MKKSMLNLVDKVVSLTLKTNVNSTTSVLVYQPEVPQELKNLKND